MRQRVDLNLKWLGATILAIVAGLAALPYLSGQAADATMRALSAVAAHERDYDRLLQALVDAESGQRGFVITGDRGFLSAYYASLGTIPATLDALHGVAADGAEKTALGRIADLVERKLAEMDATLELRRVQGAEAAGRVVADLRGKNDMDELRSLIGQRTANLSAHRLALRARMHATLGANTAMGIAASLASSLVVCIALYVAGRNLRERGQAADLAHRSAASEAAHASMAEARNQRLEVTARMLHALDSLTANAELPAVLPVFLGRLLPATCGAVYLYRDGRDALERAAAWSEDDTRGDGARYPATIEPDACWGLRLGAPHLAQNAFSLRCPHCAGRADDAAHQSLCVPMVSQGDVVGLLTVGAADGAEPIEVAVAVAAAEQLALGISNIQLREMLRRQSTVDALTGLYNRRHFDETLKRDVFRAERNGAAFSLVMVDLDHFKGINDTHGHDAGDVVLQAVARCLQDGIRRSDLACRYGGEEMALLLSACDGAAAVRCAEAIRAAVAALRLEHRGVRLPDVTASFGVALWPEHGATPDALMRAADRALYVSKHGGRDRVTLA